MVREILKAHYFNYGLDIFKIDIKTLVENGAKIFEERGLTIDYAEIYIAINEIRMSLEPERKWEEIRTDFTTEDEILRRSEFLIEASELDELVQRKHKSFAEEHAFVLLNEEEEEVFNDPEYEANHNFVVQMVDRDMRSFQSHAVPGVCGVCGMKGNAL